METWEYRVFMTYTVREERQGLGPLLGSNALASMMAEMETDGSRRVSGRVGRPLPGVLNELGQQGWELAGVDKNGDYIFKRRKP